MSVLHMTIMISKLNIGSVSNKCIQTANHGMQMQLNLHPALSIYSPCGQSDRLSQLVTPDIFFDIISNTRKQMSKTKSQAARSRSLKYVYNRGTSVKFNCECLGTLQYMKQSKIEHRFSKSTWNLDGVTNNIFQ